MYEPPRTTSEPPPITARKRGFWFWSIWVSLAGMGVLPLLCIWLGRRSYRKSVETLVSLPEFPNISPDLMRENAEQALIYPAVGAVVFLLALVYLIVSIICHLKQPKIGTRSER